MKSHESHANRNQNAEQLRLHVFDEYEMRERRHRNCPERKKIGRIGKIFLLDWTFQTLFFPPSGQIRTKKVHLATF